MGFPGGASGKDSACLCKRPETWVQSPEGRSPGGGRGNPLQYSCLENPRGQRSLAGYSPWGRKELDMPEAHTHINSRVTVTAIRDLPPFQMSFLS